MLKRGHSEIILRGTIASGRGREALRNSYLANVVTKSDPSEAAPCRAPAPTGLNAVKCANNGAGKCLYTLLKARSRQTCARPPRRHASLSGRMNLFSSTRTCSFHNYFPCRDGFSMRLPPRLDLPSPRDLHVLTVECINVCLASIQIHLDSP